ncbi:Suppressor of fused protein (SUFU) [Hymenobacter gelipurpurascens]|uniref:Suppressor of fused protein (SUFU) n=1 Tax=Hymenobacter gelipurpurascens TaxID=89968 RepID=A0A212T1I6_9BACT|nr:suppressor of fused domain protein [Hymenobacter gelipurpurascens]SNC59875.1 Suppressor of fused protein (SUFU) [Hymenobacter gelipurpurascens]
MGALEKYLEHLDRIFQIEPEFYPERTLIEGLYGVTSIVYRDIPEPGMVTGITFGLSLLDHPEWQLSRPELCISVESDDTSWARVAGYLANQGRGKLGFCYGDTINFRAQIADDSEMDAFLIFAPAILDSQDYLNIDIGQEYKINVAGLFPIYSSEIGVCHEMGFEKFWHHPDFDMYDVKRKRIQL